MYKITNILILLLSFNMIAKAELTEVNDLVVYASTEYTNGGRYAINVVNGSGLNTDETHGTSSATMWSAVDGSASFHWLKIKLQEAEKLAGMHLWNGNWVNYTNRGTKDFEIYYSSSPDDLSQEDFSASQWQFLRNESLLQAPGTSDYQGEYKYLNGIPDSVIWLGFKITSSYGGTNGYVMLSELKLYSGIDSTYIPDSIVTNDTIQVDTMDLCMPTIFGDEMVLQQNDSVLVWGEALAGEQVHLETAWGISESIAADAGGHWQFKIKTPEASFTSQYIEVRSVEDTLHFSDVLIGEVWLCAGQSNMAFRMSGDDNYAKELATVNNLELRTFQSPYLADSVPQKDIYGGIWVCSNEETLKDFSAVAYYFGKNLLDSLKNTPVALIKTAYGSATAESFMSKETLLSKPYLADHYRNYSHTTPSKNPTWCYNAMINPLLKYQMRGVLWYQGEANCVRASEYEETLTTLITSWRTSFGNEEMPFYIAQLPPYNYGSFQQEAGDAYSAATLRQAQKEVAINTPNVEYVVTMDVGDVNDIHPTNKQPVGERFAALALNYCYNFPDIDYTGPEYKSFAVEGNIIRLTFDHVENGIIDQYAELNWFCIAGTDQKFYHGNAVIDGDDILVSSPYVETPVAIRFAWHNTAVPNFFNSEGFPASPFKTDDWNTFTYVSNITSWSSLPDIRTQAFDLTIPEITEGNPAAGKRVKQTLANYQGTEVYHILHLPSNWEAGKQYPVIVEYAGNGPYSNKYGDVCTGKPDDAHLGYGISGGEDFIWIAMPFVSEDGQENQLNWWGDIEASVNYTINTVKDVCTNYGGDSTLVFVTGFSRGAIACNYIGLFNDEIADLWCASIPCSHYDGVITTWPYPDADAASAKTRLERLAGRPQLITQEGGGTGNSRAFIESTNVPGDYTYLDIPYRNHDDRWLLQDIPQRAVLRQWVKDVIECRAEISAPAVVDEGASITVKIDLKGNGPWALSYSVNDEVFYLDKVTASPYTFNYVVNDEVTFKILSVTDTRAKGTAGSETTTYVYDSEISAVYDGMVRQTQDDGIFDATATEVKKAGSWQRKSFFSFKLNELSSDSVLAAVFNVFLNASSSTEFNTTLSIFGVDEEEFSEEINTWTKAEMLTLTNIPTVVNVTENDLGAYLSFNVSDYLNACLSAGETQMTLCLQGESSHSAVFYFNTIESGENQPIISYATASFASAINNTEVDVGFALFPNPTRNFFIIKNTNDSVLPYQVFTLQGVKIKEGIVVPDNYAMISGLEEGVYFVSSKNFTKKVLVL